VLSFQILALLSKLAAVAEKLAYIDIDEAPQPTLIPLGASTRIEKEENAIPPARAHFAFARGLTHGGNSTL
jgi:hypothetical protein